MLARRQSNVTRKNQHGCTRGVNEKADASQRIASDSFAQTTAHPTYGDASSEVLRMLLRHDTDVYLDGWKLSHEFNLSVWKLHITFGFNQRSLMFSLTWF